MTDRITIYLADDHQIVIDGLQLLLTKESNLIVVGSANDGNQAFKDILFKKPNIALIDWRMPGMTGIQLIINLKKQVETKFIILSMHNDKRYITDAKNNGAFGYLLKNTGKDELMHCINKVNNNELFFPDTQHFSPSDKKVSLTPRELEILKLIINEYKSSEIAEILNLSLFTVDTHRKNICRKANTKTIVGLVKYAIDNEIEYKV